MSNGNYDDIKRSLVDLEFWNTDQSVSPQTMTRGMKGRDSGGSWRYLLVSSDGSLSNSDASNFRVSALGVSVSQTPLSADSSSVSAKQQDAANLMVSSKSGDAALMRVSAIGGTSSPLSADSSSVSAKQGDAANLRMSAFSGDAALMRVSALGVSVTTSPLSADSSSVSAKQQDAASLRVSAVQADAANLQVSGKSDSAGQLRVSAFSNDGALHRVSAILAAGVSSVGAASFGVSAAQSDATALRASAIQSDAGLQRVSAFGTVSAFINQGTVSAYSPDASLFRVSAVNSISALSPDAGLFRVSSQNIDRTTSAFMTTIGDSLSISAFGNGNLGAQLSGTWTGTVAFQGTIDETNWFPWQGVDSLANTIVSSTTTSRNVFFETTGLRRFRLSATASMTGTLSAFLDSTAAGGDSFVTVKQDDASYGRLSALQADASLLRISAIGADANTFHTSAVQGDAGLFHVSAVGTLTVSAHEVKQSDAASLLVSAKSGDANQIHVSATQLDAGLLLISAKQGDAGLLRISAIGGTAGDNTIVDGTTQTLSASLLRVSGVVSGGFNALVTYPQNRDDAVNLRVSAFSKDGGTFRVSAVNNLSANQSISSLGMEGTAFLGSVSAKSTDATNLVVSAVQKDAGLLLVSGKQGDAALFRTSAIQGDAGLQHVSASIFPDTTGGLTMFSNFNVSTSQNIKATAGAVYGWYAWNNDSKPIWVNLYNTSGAINVGTDAIKVQIYLPASAAANLTFPIGLLGFTNGIGVASVSAAVSTATTAGTASATGLNLFYK